MWSRNISPLAFGCWPLARPRKAKSKKPRAKSGSPLQQVHFVYVDRLLITEEGDQDAEADRGFGGGVGDYKNCEDLAVQGRRTVQSLPVAREGDQIQIDGVQDQFNRHQDDDYVAAGEDADDAENKQGCADNQVVQRRDVEDGI